MDKSESEYGPTDATGDLTPENELTGFSRSGNSALEKSTGLGASKSSNKGLLGSDVASKPKNRTKSPTSPSSADGDYTYTYKTTDISSQATSFNQTEMYQPPSEGETRSISDKYPESKEQIERNSPVIEEESPSKVSRGSLIVPTPLEGGGRNYILKWVFFVQSILADRYIHSRELRLVSLESLSSAEYGIKKIFLFSFLTGRYRGLNFRENRVNSVDFIRLLSEFLTKISPI